MGGELNAARGPKEKYEQRMVKGDVENTTVELNRDSLGRIFVTEKRLGQNEIPG